MSAEHLFPVLPAALIALALQSGCALPTEPGPDLLVSSPLLSSGTVATSDPDDCPPPIPNPIETRVILTQESLVIRGDVEIRSLVEDRNVSVHTNGDLKALGQSFLVEGYGSFTGSVDTEAACLNDPMSEEDEARCNFKPNNDWNEDGPSVFPDDPILIPNIDLVNLRSAATVYYDGDSNANAPYVIDSDAGFTYASFMEWAAAEALGNPTAGSTPENPFILVVDDANLELRNLIQLSGYGLLVAACKNQCAQGFGNVIVEPKGPGGGVYGQLTPDLENMMALQTTGNMEIGPNAGLVASLYAGNEIRFRGGAELTGGIVAGSLNFVGAPVRVWARGSLEVIIDPGNCPPE